MGSELVKAAPQKSYSEIFHENFPLYIAMGMNYEEYWEKDSIIVKSYRTAYKHKQQQLNQQAWMQGAYFYNALCCVSPVLHAFAKSGTKPMPYIEKPYAFEETEEEIKDKQEKEQLKARVWMENLVRNFRAGDKNGN